MSWSRIKVCFEIPQMHWMEDLVGTRENVYYYFEDSNLPAGWELTEAIPEDNSEDLLIFDVNHMPTQVEYDRVEHFILTGEQL